MYSNSGFYASTQDAAIYDQLNEGTCVENAICEGVQNLLNQAGYSVAPAGTQLSALPAMEYAAPSRQYLYNTQLDLIGSHGVDYGSIVPYTYLAAETTGIAPEYDLPYGLSNIAVSPTAQMLADGQSMKIVATKSISIDGVGADTLEAGIVAALQQGHEVQLALTVHSSLYTLTPGVTYNPFTPAIGGHDVNIVGVDDSNPLNHEFIFQNSWGTSWDAGGYGEIGFQTLISNQNSDGYGDATSVNYITQVSINGKLIDTDWTPSRVLMTEAYLVLGRTADVSGLDYWASTLDSGNTFGNVLQSLITSSEGQAHFAGESASAFVNTVYQELFARAADPGGLAFYAGELSTMSQGQVVAAIIAGAQGTDATALYNRSLVVGNGALTFQDAGLNHGAEVAALVGVNQSYSTVISAESALHHALYGV